MGIRSRSKGPWGMPNAISWSFAGYMAIFIKSECNSNVLKILTVPQATKNSSMRGIRSLKIMVTSLRRLYLTVMLILPSVFGTMTRGLAQVGANHWMRPGEKSKYISGLTWAETAG